MIPNCPILQPPTNIETINEISIDEYNTVVLSQSCDLENSKIEIVLVCPYYELSYFLSVHPDSKNGGKGIDRTINNLLQGNYPSYHILNKNEELRLNDYIVVDFRNVYGVNYGFLINHVENIESRIRLLPPYRERVFLKKGNTSQQMIRGAYVETKSPKTEPKHAILRQKDLTSNVCKTSF